MKVLFLFFAYLIFFWQVFVNACEDEIGKIQDKYTSKEININTLPRCECGIFKSTNPYEKHKPIIKHNPINLTCNFAGIAACRKICKKLGILILDNINIKICNEVFHVDNLKASLYSRICRQSWEYINLTLESPICCRKGKVKSCHDLENHKNCPQGAVTATDVPYNRFKDINDQRENIEKEETSTINIISTNRKKFFHSEYTEKKIWKYQYD